MTMPVPPIDPQPLRALVESKLNEDTTHADLAPLCGYRDARTLRKALERPLSLWTVDRICQGLGEHPSLIYGASWWLLGASEDLTP